MPTTSRPPRRKGKASIPQVPLKRIRLSVTLVGAAGKGLEAAAAEKGIKAYRKGGDLSLSFTAVTPEEALDRLRLLSDLLASKG